MKVGNHPKVWQYDGAFKCYACDQSWGAVTGNPPMPEKCEREERRKKERRAKEQPGERRSRVGFRNPERREQNAELAVIPSGDASALTVTPSQPQVSAPDAAAMVRRLRDYANVRQMNMEHPQVRELLREAADMLEKLGQLQPVHRECEQCGLLVACWSDAQIEAIERDAAMIGSKITPPPPERP